MKNLFRFCCLLAAGASSGHSTVAQAQPVPVAKPNTGLGIHCPAARTAARRPLSSPRHGQQMARYDVKYYKLDLALENTSVAVAGSVRMQARNGGAALDSLAFELYPTYTIDSVVVQGRRAPGWRRVAGDVSAKLAVAVPAGQLFNAFIYYHGTAPSSGPRSGLATNQDPASGVTVTYSLSQPFYSYQWFPCKQVLTDKADSSDVWVTTTLLNKVGSNGVLQRVTPLPGGKARYEWKSRHPIAYYLISVAVAPYVEYTNYAHPAGSPAIPIVNYLYNQAAIDQARPQLDLVPAMIENFSSLVGPYPFANEKYGHCLVPTYPGTAIENQTMTTIGAIDDPILVSHELFHQWFGDNVTCASWQDIWLNEGFATYGSYLTLQALSPADARTFIDQGTALVMSEPGGSVRVLDTLNVDRILYQRLSYAKGAAIVHMLRYLLNDDAKFFRALRTYQSTYAGRAARTRDLQRIFEAEAGRSLQYFFDQWYQGEGYPTFTVRWNQSGNTLYLQSSETVSMPAVTPFFDTEVDYKLSFADGTSQIVRLRQGQPVSGYSLAVAGTVTGLEVDPQQWILNGEGTVTRDPALVLGTRGGAAAARLSVYPVPCREYLRLAAVPGGPVQAEVSDASGRVVLRQGLPAGADRLVTAGLPAGLYHLRLFDGQGRVSQTHFIRE
ncbi:T9SS type A sorting domain-containing protein [Hymenobacter sp. BT664]|uniref:Aminopeptidase N n=1 Tax=Hymenobacter montanus TaxID=2771359 RepID=A0A927GK81_9BACT|nr:M1 family metallopeptidase [Hymenobacter montanus]MBD2769195.1 T9SS type A sorting domain-containing protein [Hymenobacter montanus]